MTLISKLAQIRRMCEVITKNKSGYGYKYVSIDEILARVTAGMNKYDVALVPMIQQETMTSEPYQYIKTKVLKDGRITEEHINEIMVKGCITYRWINVEDTTDILDVPWYITGSQSDPSQALGSSLSYSLRQMLMNFFQIAALDDSDPDSWRSKQKETEEAENKAIAKEIVEQVNGIVNKHLSEHPDDRDKISEIIKKHAKDKRGASTANYYAIESPEVAAALLKEIKNALGVVEDDTHEE